mgnify:CR=1 FL=1
MTVITTTDSPAAPADSTPPARRRDLAGTTPLTRRRGTFAADKLWALAFVTPYVAVFVAFVVVVVRCKRAMSSPPPFLGRTFAFYGKADAAIAEPEAGNTIQHDRADHRRVEIPQVSFIAELGGSGRCFRRDVRHSRPRNRPSAWRHPRSACRGAAR